VHEDVEVTPVVGQPRGGRVAGITVAAGSQVAEGAKLMTIEPMAWAMPQAIERSVATPTIRARLPASIPMIASPPGLSRAS